MSRIADTFANLKRANRRGFIPFITAGDPDLHTTRQLIVELARAGATLIELGIPFSDPMADGPVIQRASERALQHRFGISDVLQIVSGARKETDEFASILRANDLDMIFLIAPTSTDQRLQMVAERASGFIYAVSRAGITGARKEMSAEAEKLVRRMRTFSDLPIAVGFGISTPEHIKDVWRY